MTSPRRKNLAWEVRKRSPSKPLSRSYRSDVIHPTNHASSRCLDFTNQGSPLKDGDNGGNESEDVGRDLGGVIASSEGSDVKKNSPQLKAPKSSLSNVDKEGENKPPSDVNKNNSVSNSVDNSASNNEPCIKKADDTKSDNKVSNLAKNNSVTKGTGVDVGNSSSTKTWADKVRSVSASTSECVTSSSSSLASIHNVINQKNAADKNNNKNNINNGNNNTGRLKSKEKIVSARSNVNSNNKNNNNNGNRKNLSNRGAVLTSQSAGKLSNKQYNSLKDTSASGSNKKNAKGANKGSSNNDQGNNNNNNKQVKSNSAKRRSVASEAGPDGWEMVSHRSGKHWKQRISLDNNMNNDNGGVNNNSVATTSHTTGRQNNLYKSYSFDNEVKNCVEKNPSDAGDTHVKSEFKDEKGHLAGNNKSSSSGNLLAVHHSIHPSSSSILPSSFSLLPSSSIAPLFIKTNFDDDDDEDDDDDSNLNNNKNNTNINNTTNINNNNKNITGDNNGISSSSSSSSSENKNTYNRRSVDNVHKVNLLTTVDYLDSLKKGNEFIRIIV